MMKSVGRRLFAKVAVGVPTVLKMPTGVAPPPPQMNGCGMPMTAASGALNSGLRDAIWKALRTQGRAENERENERYTARQMMGGLDPDLSVLNSMSLARRVAIQLERNMNSHRRLKGVAAAIVRTMGGNPEDFE